MFTAVIKYQSLERNATTGSSVIRDNGTYVGLVNNEYASRIVNALNSHDELLTVARGCLGYFDYLKAQAGGQYAPDEKWLAPLRATIAKAEGR